MSSALLVVDFPATTVTALPFELETNRIDAIPLRWLARFLIHRPIVEDVPEVRPACAADHFGAMHAVRGIFDEFHFFHGHRIGK